MDVGTNAVYATWTRHAWLILDNRQINIDNLQIINKIKCIIRLLVVHMLVRSIPVDIYNSTYYLERFKILLYTY